MSVTAIVEAIASEIQTGAVALDSGKKVLYANPFILKSFKAKGELSGRPLSELFEDKSLLSAVDAAVLKADSGGFEVDSKDEFIEIRESGRYYNARLVPITDGNLLIFLRDTTEEKRVEAIKKDFVANVSHELRTPLASIKGYSETLLDGGMDDFDTARDFLRVIDKNATRMSRLINDLLILSRLEGEQISIELTRLDINELVNSMLPGFTKLAADKGVSLSSCLTEEPMMLFGDRDRLEQVMVNLLDNAIKYTPKGGSVCVGFKIDGGEVQVYVTDTGLGIPKKDLPRIFERFYRVDKARSREMGGTGLGLAIVKHILQGHGGRVWVESETGKGSTFSFTLKAAS